jgi:ribose 5-phosphate isomerase B
MKIYVGADHAGFAHKEAIQAWLMDNRHEVIDLGANEMNENDDYPDFIVPVAEAVSRAAIEGNREVRGIILGGSGQGEAIAANRFPFARAALYYGGNPAILTLSREHNNANILSLGARFMSPEGAVGAVRSWLITPFSEEERSCFAGSI